jgi:crossover junction endodeoxyribonuclease RusA
MAGRLAVSIEAFPPDRRKRDLDNMLKALLDSMTHAGIWHDDDQIDEVRIVRREATAGGMMRVVVSEVGPEA